MSRVSFPGWWRVLSGANNDILRLYFVNFFIICLCLAIIKRIMLSYLFLKFSPSRRATSRSSISNAAFRSGTMLVDG